MTIRMFTGKYAVFHNEFMVDYYCEEEDTVYPTIQHAFEACKTDAPCKKRYISELPVEEAKKATKKWRRWPDWPMEKLFCMQELVIDKFSIGPKAEEYTEILLSTGDEEIIFEGPDADPYWGVVDGVGENHLGNILMDLREEIQNERRIGDSDGV